MASRIDGVNDNLHSAPNFHRDRRPWDAKQPILVKADVNERSEVSHVAHRATHFHATAEVL